MPGHRAPPSRSARGGRVLSRRAVTGRRPRRLLPRLLGGAMVAGLAAVLLVAAHAVVNPVAGLHMRAERERLGAIEREWVALERIGPAPVLAVIAAEDARFCAHAGLDWQAIRAAWEANARGSPLRGGSTITQQVAKNVFLWPARSWVRKGLEAGIALVIEATWSKRRIVEVYLNVAEFDTGVFGIEAAARHHFGVSAEGLSDPRAARLAAVLPDPKGRSAVRPTPRTRARASAILRGMRTLRADGRADCALP